MDIQLVKTKQQEIVQLYTELRGHTIKVVCQIGKLLIEVKEQVGHGNFEDWVDEHLPFTIKSAQNYMNVYRLSEQQELPADIELCEVYKLLPHKINTGKNENFSFLGQDKEPQLGSGVRLQEQTIPETTPEPEPAPEPKETDYDGILRDLKAAFKKLPSEYQGKFIDWVLDTYGKTN